MKKEVLEIVKVLSERPELKEVIKNVMEIKSKKNLKLIQEIVNVLNA